MQNIGNVHKKLLRLQVMAGNGISELLTLHLRLTCITFTDGQLITFSVKLYYIYGEISYYI